MYDKYFSREELARLPLYTRGPDGDPSGLRWSTSSSLWTRAGQGGYTAPTCHRWLELSSRYQRRSALVGEAEPNARAGARHADARAFPKPCAIMCRLLLGKQAAYLRKISDTSTKRLARAWRSITATDPGVATLSQRSGTLLFRAHSKPAGLARHWLELFSSYAGKNPATHAKFRLALKTEPDLSAGTWADDATAGVCPAGDGTLAK
uniref:Albicidin binding protein n=1 Tax=Alcaligenes xylosoxydans xylosoxydans TaxID=85698 RepID=Q44567_ALCXX|nr:albicidin binding protein [Achromobacter xylosoxidans]